ncbi:hypothetical protein Tco_0262598, partial [Tanacetum coccineum]
RDRVCFLDVCGYLDCLIVIVDQGEFISSLLNYFENVLYTREGDNACFENVNTTCFVLINDIIPFTIEYYAMTVHSVLSRDTGILSWHDLSDGDNGLRFGLGVVDGLDGMDADIKDGDLVNLCCRKSHLLEDKQIPNVGVFDEAHLEKKRTRLWTYTKYLRRKAFSAWGRRLECMRRRPNHDWMASEKSGRLLDLYG